MKKSFIYGAMALIGAGLLSACSDEPAVDVNKTSGVYGSATGGFSSSDIDSRTTVDEDNSFNLVREWLGHETVAVFDQETGTNLGALKNTEAAKSTFSGTLFYDWTSGSHNVTVAYLGEKAAAANRDLNSTISVDITTQNGSLASLVDHDVQVAHTAFNVTDGGWDLSFNVQSVLSFIHYFIALPDGVDYNDEIITITGLNSKGTLNLLDGTFSAIEKAPSTAVKGIKSTVEGKNGMDLYLAVIPGANQELSFSVTIDNVTYTGTRNPHTFEANVYYRRADGTGGNIPVVNTEERNITYALPHTSLDGTWSWKKIVADNTPITVGDFTERSTFDNLMAGWRLDSWKHNDETVADNTANYSLAAGVHTFTAVIYKAIVYDANGGQFSNGENTATKEFDKITPNIRPYYEEPTREGYTFVGWKDSNNYTFTNLVSSSEYGKEKFPDVTTTLTAVWEKDESSLNVNAPNMPGSNPWGK